MIKKIVIFLILLIIFTSNYSYATDEIIKSQMEELNISSFIKEGQAYTKEAFPNINIESTFNNLISGNISNKQVINQVINIFGNEVKTTFSLIASVFVIIVINSILKSFSDSLQNNGVSQIAYYVEYILIVTLIMSNFSKIIVTINNSLSNLVGFASTLVPILLALMSASRKHSIC